MTVCLLYCFWREHFEHLSIFFVIVEPNDTRMMVRGTVFADGKAFDDECWGS